MSKEFFTRNKLLMDGLLKFAPEDDNLLHIPLFTSAIDPFVLCFMRANRKYNHGITLLGFMQSINSVFRGFS